MQNKPILYADDLQIGAVTEIDTSSDRPYFIFSIIPNYNKKPDFDRHLFEVHFTRPEIQTMRFYGFAEEIRHQYPFHGDPDCTLKIKTIPWRNPQGKETYQWQI